jgi:hypothetical protein
LPEPLDINTGYFAVLKSAVSPTYTNFQRLLKRCDIIFLDQILARIPILANGATIRTDYLGN